MRRHSLESTATRLRLVALAAFVPVIVPVASDAQDPGVGEAETLLVLPDGDHPEGVTFDRDGNLYFSNRRGGPPGFQHSELRKITPGGQDTVIATFASSPGSALLGLAADGDGDVFAAVDGGADHGVWRVSGNGNNRVRVEGSEEIHFPNAITLDAEGNVYVTDSGPVVPEVGGAIWILRRDASTTEVWSTDMALAPFPFDPFGFPLPGANGIAFSPPDSLYVANTEKSQLVRIPILPDGSAGPAEEVTAAFSVPTIDGIAVDVKGNVYCVLPGHAVLGAPPVVKVDPATGSIAAATLPGFDGLFDIPLSLAFDTLPGERTNVVVTNGDLPVAVVGPGPSLLRANVGVKGLLLR